MKSNTNLYVLIFFILGLMAAYSIFKPFILPIVVAILLGMATSNLTRYFSNKFHSKKLSTFVTVIFMVILILVPLGYIATIGISYATQLDIDTLKTILNKSRTIASEIPYIGDNIQKYLTVDFILPYVQDISIYIGKMGTKGIEFVKDTFLVVIFYSFFVYNQEKIMKFIISILPTTPRRSNFMLDEISSTMEIVFYSILVTAILEGLLFGIFVSFYHFNGLFLGFIYGFASLIPIIGGAIVWIPVSLLAWTKIDSSSAITIALYSVIVISIFADTFIKPFIIKVIKDNILRKTTKIDELLIFFSIIAGMSSYGFWGMIIGPAVITFLIATTNAYIDFNKKFNQIE